MHISMGMDSRKFVREAYRATLRAAAFCSSVAGTIPKIFFWLGQMSTQTLNNMMVPSQAPIPMMILESWTGFCSRPKVKDSNIIMGIGAWLGTIMLFNVWVLIW